MRGILVDRKAVLERPEIVDEVHARRRAHRRVHAEPRLAVGCGHRARRGRHRDRRSRHAVAVAAGASPRRDGSAAAASPAHRRLPVVGSMQRSPRRRCAMSPAVRRVSLVRSRRRARRARVARPRPASPSPSRARRPAPSTRRHPRRRRHRSRRRRRLETNLPDAEFALPARARTSTPAAMLGLAQGEPAAERSRRHDELDPERRRARAPRPPASRPSAARGAQPSESGLATNVSVVDAARPRRCWTRCAPRVRLRDRSGTARSARSSRRTVDLDDNEVTLGETHFVRGDGWVSTAWINFAPEGYTEDIVATLWG